MSIEPSAWSEPWTTDDRCTRHQAQQAEIDLRDWLDGKPHAAFDALKAVVEPAIKTVFTFLEIGAGCGYNLEVLRSIQPWIIYQGIDISPAMVEYAEKRYGYQQFVVGSATELPFADAAFDCTCLAAVIQHMPDYRPAIREAVSVSKRYVILHRIEATTEESFTYRHAAYDTELPTRIINCDELLEFCEASGLRKIGEMEWGRSGSRFNASWLLEKT